MLLLKVVTVMIGIPLYLVGVKCDNYPDDDLNPKPCARICNTVTYLKSICEPDCNGGFTDQSRQNCEGEFKSLCPEFNRADCVWYTLDHPDVGPRDIPCCRLQYHARRYDWMQIFYSHQYGPWLSDYKTWTKDNGGNCSSRPFNSIVEIHREVRKYGAFGYRGGYEDWPGTVVDATGERGLKWNQLTDFKPLPDDLRNNTAQLCHFTNNTDQEKLCQDSFTKYLTSSGYNIGFNNASDPKPSDNEKTIKNTVNYILNAHCSDIYVGVPGNQTVQRGCQVLYTRKTTYTPDGGDKFVCEFVYLEANAYTPSANNLSHMEMRFSYWYAEDPNDRLKISCRRATAND